MTIHAIKSLAVCGSNILAGTGYSIPISDGGIFISTNNGNEWSRVTSNTSNKTIFCFAVKDSMVLAGSWMGLVLISKDSGKTWNQIPITQTTTVVRSVVFSDSSIYAGTDQNGIFRSTNFGSSWEAVNTGLTNLAVYSLLSENGRLIAGTYGGGVFISTNSGISWNAINTGITNKYIRCLVFVKNNYFAGTDGGNLFQWRDSDTSWTLVDEDLPNSNIMYLAVNDKKLFVSTYGDGIWGRSLAELNVITTVLPNIYPAIFQLHQNYPNPFNPVTTISYDLPKSGNVILKIFDALGKEVFTLVDGYQSSGRYAVLFNASNFASGMYIYKMVTDNYSAVHKMMLIK